MSVERDHIKVNILYSVLFHEVRFEQRGHVEQSGGVFRELQLLRLIAHRLIQLLVQSISVIIRDCSQIQAGFFYPSARIPSQGPRLIQPVIPHRRRSQHRLRVL